jgi:hypothetical protein
VSVVILAAVSFFAVSTVVVCTESVVLVESVVEDEEEPLQAAKEAATIKATEAILSEFFIVCYIFCFLVNTSKRKKVTH